MSTSVIDRMPRPIPRRPLPQRNIERQAWSCWPSPRSEAKNCLKIAQRNGGVAGMREVIAVSDRERRELLQWIEQEPALADKVFAAIAYRERVLAEFNALVGNKS
jgi:hypothetical protein